MTKKDLAYCGHIALLGRTNVGKSSLLNALASVRVSATAPLPNTTRGAIYKRIHTADKEVVCIDTPGDSHLRKGDLQTKLMHKQMLQVLLSAEGRVFVVDAPRYGKQDEHFLRYLTQERSETPLLLVLNKIDLLAQRTELFPLVLKLSEQLEKMGLKARETIPVSAVTGKNIQILKQAIFSMLPETSRTPVAPDTCDAFIVSELLREQLFRRLKQEIPFGLCVLCDHLENRKEPSDMFFIHLSVLVEKESHKAILLGKDGMKMKSMASAARKSMEAFFGKKVMLRVRIQTQKSWKTSASVLSKTILGRYDDRPARSNIQGQFIIKDKEERPKR